MLKELKKDIENKSYRVYSQDVGFLGLGKCSLDTQELLVERLLVKRD